MKFWTFGVLSIQKNTVIYSRSLQSLNIVLKYVFNRRTNRKELILKFMSNYVDELINFKVFFH